MPLILKNNIGDLIFDYIQILESNDLKLAKEYISEWNCLIDDKHRSVWNGRKHVHCIIFTLERFKRSSKVIEITEQLLKELEIDY